jgi:hypothetical protein
VAQACVADAGLCTGPPTNGGAWHAGGAIGTKDVGPCSWTPTSQCPGYKVISTDQGTLRWYELLLSPLVDKVNQDLDADGDPVARAEILNLAWNQSLNIGSFATFTWELDNDVDDPAQMDLIGDLDVLGSINGPLGVVAGGLPPEGVGYPLFAAPGFCAANGGVCVQDADCPFPEFCAFAGESTNGSVGNNREGQDSCVLEIIFEAEPLIELAGPADDDADNNGLGGTDEFVAANGPIRNMDIRRAGGPDLQDVLLEDLVGDTGLRMQAAFGFLVEEGPEGNPAQPQLGVTIDDVVLEWREVELVPDDWGCGPGEVALLGVGKAAGGAVEVHYEPACRAQDHSIVWGDLANVGNLPAGYSGAVCSIGNSGEHLGFDPQPGSYFFMVVASDGATTEGSYGEQAPGVERAPRPDNCGLTQDLSDRCD